MIRTAEDMLEAVAAHSPAFSLPAGLYNDQVAFDLDMELIFRRDWLAVGHTCEVREPGEYFTVKIGTDSIIVVRGRDNAIRAFFNTCRHRGSIICLDARGKRTVLVCPYHQWTYSLDGRLAGAREMGEDFDKSLYSLHPVSVETVGGIIYVCLAKQPPSFDEYKRIVDPYVAPHGTDDLKVAAEISIVEKGNWKLVWENNRECYHCAVGHPTLIKSLPQTDDPNDPVTTPRTRLRMQQCFDEWERLGLPYKAVNEDAWRITRMPLNDDCVSMTEDGSPAVKNFRLGTLPDTDVGSLRNLHLPNTWNHFQGDHCISFRVLPVSPFETQLTTKWLVPKDAVEGRDYDVDNLTRVWNATNDEDRTFVERNQIGVMSSAYQPGPYSPKAEIGVSNFIRWYCSTMLERLPSLTARNQARPRLARVG